MRLTPATTVTVSALLATSMLASAQEAAQPAAKGRQPEPAKAAAPAPKDGPATKEESKPEAHPAAADQDAKRDQPAETERRGGDAGRRNEPEPSGGVRPQPSLAEAPTLDPSWVEALKWRSIGPAAMGGRITGFAVNPNDPTNFFVATAGGGVLKTTTNGTTFDYLFDHESVSSIGAVAVAASDPKVVWVGTGEANPRNSVSWGDGVYKSTDGGKTWHNMGLKDSYQIGRIVISPKDPDVVYVAAMGRCWGPGGDRGLYRTTDGGKTWDHVINIDDKTGCIDVAMSPADPNLILAAAWERQRSIYDSNDPAKKWGPGSGLYRSTDGKTFTKISQGLPTSDLGRIGIDFYLKDPSHVYITVDCAKIGAAPDNAPYMGLTGENADAGARITRIINKSPAAEAKLKTGDIITAVDDKPVASYDALLAAVREHKPEDTVKLAYARDHKGAEAELKLSKRPGDGSDRPYGFALGGQSANIQDQQGTDGYQLGGVYASTDSGETWKRINSLNPRPMYFSQIRVDPTDEKNIYVAGVALHVSHDNGKTFKDDGAPGVHADFHAMWIDPANDKHMLVGCDGGIYCSYDQGKSWDHLNNAAIGQFYCVAIDQTPMYRVYGGLQDNGSWGGPNRTRAGGTLNDDWFRVGGGDGFVCAVDPDNPDRIYSESQNGGTTWRDLKTGEGGSVRPQPPQGSGLRYRFNWKTPFIISAHNSRIYYNAGNYVFRTYQTGKSTIKRISPEISRTDKGSATALSESPLDPDVLYAGTDDGALWMTRDGGKTWYDLFKELPKENEIAATEPTRRGGRFGGRGAGLRMTQADLLARFDENNDGKIDRSELPDQMGRMFDDVDENGDGVLEKGEIDALATRMQQGFGRRGRGGGFGGGGGGGGSAGGPGEGGPRRAGAPGAEEQTETPEEPTETAAAERQRESAGAEPTRGTGSETARNAGADQPVERPTPGAGRGEPAASRPETIAGQWHGTVTGDAPPGMNGFDLTIELKEGETVGGDLRSEMGEFPVTGSFDTTAGQLRLTFDGPTGETTVEAKLDEGKFTGTLTGRGGSSIDFSAERVQTRPRFAARRNRPARPQLPPGKPLSELVPEPRCVASIEASRYEPGRVYVALDCHRSNEDGPCLIVSEDFGRTWRSIAGNLPMGSTRVLREDIKVEDLLYCGTECGCFVSIDRGKDWTKLNSNMPTVAVHEFAQHRLSGEIVAATHGRSLWVLDATPLRQMTEQALAAASHLYKPADVTLWHSEPQRGTSGVRPFRGSMPTSGAQIVYSIKSGAQDVALKVTTLDGTLIRTLSNPPKEPGLHALTWDLRRNPPERRNGAGPGGGPGGFAFGGGGGFGGRGRFGGQRIEAGPYRVVLTVDGQEQTQDFKIETDPDYPQVGAAADGDQDWSADQDEEEEEMERGADPGEIVH